MDDTINSDKKGDRKEGTASLHINSQECNCPDCNKQKRHYIQILNMEQYVEQLNDWD